MRHHAQDSIDRQMQQDIRNYRHHDWHHQRVPIARPRAIHDPSEWRIERVCNSNNKLNKTRAAVRRQQRQQKSHRQQRVYHIKNVVDDLGNARSAAASLYFALSR